MNQNCTNGLTGELKLLAHQASLEDFKQKYIRLINDIYIFLKVNKWATEWLTLDLWFEIYKQLFDIAVCTEVLECDSPVFALTTFSRFHKAKLQLKIKRHEKRLNELIAQVRENLLTIPTPPLALT